MSKVKLNQIVALNSPKKADFQKLISKFHHILQKTEPFFGVERKYTPKEDGGEQYPSEGNRVQLKVKDLVDEIQSAWINMFDVVLTNDVGNGNAKADIIIDEQVIAKDIPITTLLFLEKQLGDWKTLLEKLPVLPFTEEWQLDNSSGLYSSPVTQTVKTKKIEKPIVLYAATDKHPAQTQMITEDVIVGHWNTKRFSSALPSTYVEDLLKKLTKLREAVITAREHANSLEINQINKGKEIIDYLFS